MYLKSLTIATKDRVVREIFFHKGLNLIVDKTPLEGVEIKTGNNVGKTTVLRLVDFCLGHDANSLYVDEENKRDVNHKVKDFLIDNEVLITLTLVDNLDMPSQSVFIERNFLQRGKRIYKINGTPIGSSKQEIDDALKSAIFPTLSIDKPTFRQLIAHNIRYNELRLSNTLKVLNSFTSAEEYEALFLFMFGCNYNDGEERNRLLAQIDKEDKFRRRLEKNQTKGAYKVALGVVDNEIAQLEEKKKRLNINPELEFDVEQLNQVKSQLNKVLSDVAVQTMRKQLILDAQHEVSTRQFREDLSVLQTVYNQAKTFIPELHKSFQDLVNYHNRMLENRASFIAQELPELETKITTLQEMVNDLHTQELILQDRIIGSNTFAELEEIILQLNERYKQKGAYESAIDSINEVEKNIAQLRSDLNKIDNTLFSEAFQDTISRQLAKFNVLFAQYSDRLYKEQYAIKCDLVMSKSGKQTYQFAPIDVNFSTGKKQGEISCFDLAYIKFADLEGIPTLHFLLTDKRELMHGNQLNIISQIANENEVQFIASILEDKITLEMRNDANYVVELSQDDKLFRF